MYSAKDLPFGCLRYSVTTEIILVILCKRRKSISGVMYEEAYYVGR